MVNKFLNLFIPKLWICLVLDIFRYSFLEGCTAWKVSKYGVFLSVFSCIQIEYGDLLRKSPYSVQRQENTDQKKLRIWTLSRSDEVGNANMNKQTALVRYSAASCTAWKVSILGVILFRIFPHLDWIRRDIPCLSVFSPNGGKCGPE